MKAKADEHRCVYCGELLRPDQLSDSCLGCSILARKIDMKQLAEFVRKVVANNKS